MEDAGAATVTRIGSTNGSSGQAPEKRRRGRKKNPNPPQKYNLHVVLYREEYELFRALAKGLGATDFTRQLIVGAAVQAGLLSINALRSTTARPPACSPPGAAVAACTSIAS